MSSAATATSIIAHCTRRCSALRVPAAIRAYSLCVGEEVPNSVPQQRGLLGRRNRALRSYLCPHLPIAECEGAPASVRFDVVFVDVQLGAARDKGSGLDLIREFVAKRAVP